LSSDPRRCLATAGMFRAAGGRSASAMFGVQLFSGAAKKFGFIAQHREHSARK